MDRIVVAAGIAVIIGLGAAPAVIDPAGNVVSRDPHLATFAGTVETDEHAIRSLNGTTMGPWLLDGAAVFPAEAAAVLEQDALVLRPTTGADGTTRTAAIAQRVTLPDRRPLTVRVRARNAAVFGDTPVTYWDRYCADTALTVTARTADGTRSTETRQVIDYREAEISLDVSTFAGRTAIIEATADLGPTPCGIDRTNMAYLSYFAVEHGG